MEKEKEDARLQKQRQEHDVMASIAKYKLTQRCSSLIPKNVTSERPMALVPTLIRWCEAQRASEVAMWQLKYRDDWDATDGRNGGVSANSVVNFDVNGKM